MGIHCNRRQFSVEEEVEQDDINFPSQNIDENIYKILGGPGCGKTTEILNILGRKFREKLHPIKF